MVIWRQMAPVLEKSRCAGLYLYQGQKLVWNYSRSFTTKLNLMTDKKGGSPERGKAGKKSKVPLSGELLTLFQRQELEVAGELFVKPSRFQKSRKYHVELRKATIVAFRSAQAARSKDVGIADVVFVFSVSRYDFEIIQIDDSQARISILWKPRRGESVMFIKVTGGQRELDAWRYGLARSKAFPPPVLKDLTIESIIGRGGGGKVFMITWKQETQVKTYALKVIAKARAFKSGKTFRHVVSERYLMERIGHHPFLLRMQFAFQTHKNLFIGTPFCRGGDLASYLRAKGDKSFPCNKEELESLCLSDQRRRRIYGRLSEEQTRLIAAEVILALEHLHQQGIVYRDLKPENIFIDETGHLKLGDYGLAKLIDDESTDGEQKTDSMCGTRNYLPPEMLSGKTYSYEADMWSFGVMLYRIMCGAFPFEATRTKDLFRKVTGVNPIIPRWISAGARQLLIDLLQKDPKLRPSTSSIKQEAFFHGVNWDDVLKCRVGPSVPECVRIGTGSFDPLENFELSKLQGLTVGEYDVGCDGGEENEVNDVATHEQKVGDLVIGFEYCFPQTDEKKVAPLVVKQRSGGIFPRVGAIDTSVIFQRKRSSLDSNGLFSKLASLDLGISLRPQKEQCSPTGVQEGHLGDDDDC